MKCQITSAKALPLQLPFPSLSSLKRTEPITIYAPHADHRPHSHHTTTKHGAELENASDNTHTRNATAPHKPKAPGRRPVKRLSKRQNLLTRQTTQPQNQQTNENQQEHVVWCVSHSVGWNWQRSQARQLADSIWSRATYCAHIVCVMPASGTAGIMMLNARRESRAPAANMWHMAHERIG